MYYNIAEIYNCSYLVYDFFLMLCNFDDILLIILYCTTFTTISYIFQFPDTVAFAEEMANKDKIVIVAALDGTFQQEVKQF